MPPKVQKCQKSHEQVQSLTNAPTGVDNISEVLSLLVQIEKETKQVHNSTTLRLWSYSVALRLQILRVITDLASEKSFEISKEKLNLMDECYEVLLERANQLPNEELKRNAELYLRMNQFCCNIAFKLQKKKMYKEAVLWTDRTLYVAEQCEDSAIGTDKQKPNKRYPSLLKSECLRLDGKIEESLEWMAKLWESESPSTCYDVFDQIQWAKLCTHWIAGYKDAVFKNPSFNKTTMDYNGHTNNKVLRMELDAHFSGRHGVPSGMVAIGKALVESKCPVDNVIGYIGQSTGYFWSPAHVEDAVELLHECAEFMREGFFEKEENLDKTAFLQSLLFIWRGICLLRNHQLFVEAELGTLKHETEEEKSVSGFSSVNLQNEKDWVDSLAIGVEILFRLAEGKNVLETICPEIPSLLMITARIAASLLTAVGHTIVGVKAWHVVNVLARLNDKKGLIVISASEMLKIIPDLNSEAVLAAEKANIEAGDSIKHNRAYVCRLPLAKSIAYLNLKKYPEGVEELLKVFEWLENSRDNFDSTHHLMGEATYVLALYKKIQYSHEIDLSRFPKALVKMSPAGVCGKGYKTICGMTRDLDAVHSGWTDLMHNYYILNSIMVVGAETVQLLKDSGRTREMRCYVTDSVHFAQHCGLISRSLNLLISIIQLDLEARNFIHAQTKIDVVNEIFKKSVIESQVNDDKESLQKLIDNMKLTSLNIQRLETKSDLKWALKSLNIPSLYYRNRSEKTVGILKKDLREGFGKESFTFPSFMCHNLTCSCYICTSPIILPMSYVFYHAQALYLSCMSKAKSGLAVLESAKLNHERCIFRLIYNLSLLSVPLEVMSSSRRSALKAVELIYTPYCVDPGLHSLLTQMMICPSTDIKMILGAMKKALILIDTLDSKDYLRKSGPWELGISAIHEYFVSSGKISINGSEFRDILRKHLNKENKENKSKTPPQNLKAVPSLVGRKLHKKGKEIPDITPIIVPILTFDVEEESERRKFHK